LPQLAYIETVRADLACPACGYNLRGLQGAVVTCPECGIVCDIAKLIANQWSRPWYQAPGFNRLAVPTFWLYVASFFSIGFIASSPFPLVAFCALATLVLGIFGLLLYWIRRWWGGSEGLLLALVPVVLVPGFFFGILGLVGCVIALIGGRGVRIMAAVMIPVLAMLIVACRQGEKFMAHRCIKHHLEVTGLRVGPGETANIPPVQPG
jgi:hypothetical protein